MLNTSLIVPLSPAKTTTDEPVVVLLPVEVDKPELALLVNPLLVTVAVSPFKPFTQVLTKVSVGAVTGVVTVLVHRDAAGQVASAVPLNTAVFATSGSAANVGVTGIRKPVLLPIDSPAL